MAHALISYTSQTFLNFLLLSPVNFLLLSPVNFLLLSPVNFILLSVVQFQELQFRSLATFSYQHWKIVETRMTATPKANGNPRKFFNKPANAFLD
jgi:hypothetical protein